MELMTKPNLLDIDFSHLPKVEGVLDWTENHLKLVTFSWQRDALEAVETNQSLEIILAIIGQRGGTSTFLSILNSYLLQQYLIQPVNKNLSGWRTALLGALTQTRAKNLLMEPLQELMKSTLWFYIYNGTLEHYTKTNDFDYPLYKVSSSHIIYSNVGLNIRTTQPEKNIGGNLLWAIWEEFDWVPNAIEIYSATNDALKTAGDYTYRAGLGVYTSSPQFKDGPITKIESSLGDNTYSVRLPSWEANSNLYKDSPPIIKRYKADQNKAERDYGAFTYSHPLSPR